MMCLVIQKYTFGNDLIQIFGVLKRLTLFRAAGPSCIFLGPGKYIFSVLQQFN